MAVPPFGGPICQAPCRGGGFGYCAPMLTDLFTPNRRMFTRSAARIRACTYSRPRNSVTSDWKWWTPFSRLAEKRPRSYERERSPRWTSWQRPMSSC